MEMIDGTNQKNQRSEIVRKTAKFEFAEVQKNANLVGVEKY